MTFVLFLIWCAMTIPSISNHPNDTFSDFRKERVWINMLHHFRYKLNSAMVSEDALLLLSNISDFVSVRYAFVLTKSDQYALSEFYGSTISKLYDLDTMMSQRTLVESMKVIIVQNIKLGLSLEPFVWYRFFSVFYRLQHRFRDKFICKLLGMMQSEGVRTSLHLISFYRGFQAMKASKVERI